MILQRPEVFLDTSFAIALSVEDDQHHVRAVRLSRVLEASAAKLVTTRTVLFEIGNSLSKPRYREAGFQLLDSIIGDPRVEIIETTDELFEAALGLFHQRTDKDWGLVDCASFEVMRERGITEALTADVHFEQCGFRALLRKPT